MKPISHTAMVVALAAAVMGAGAGTAAHADPSPDPPTPDYVCDGLYTTNVPALHYTQVTAANCQAQHGAAYGSFTDKVIAEREDPQAHIRCWSGVVSPQFFMARNVDCHLLWYKKP